MKARYVLCLFVIFSILLANTELAEGQSTAFTYQGRLTANAGPANGNFDFTFALFPTNSGGAMVANLITNTGVAVSNGVFTVTLNYGNVFDGDSYWLEIGVRTNSSASGFTTLTPRQNVSGAPYSMYSLAAGSVTGVLAATNLPANVALLNGNANFTGTLTASGFAGNGAGLTNLAGTQITWASNLVSSSAMYALDSGSDGNSIYYTNGITLTNGTTYFVHLSANALNAKGLADTNGASVVSGINVATGWGTFICTSNGVYYLTSGSNGSPLADYIICAASTIAIPANLNVLGNNATTSVQTRQNSNTNFGQLVISNGEFADPKEIASGNYFFINDNHGDSVGGNGSEIQWQFNQMYFGPRPDGGHVQFGLGSQRPAQFLLWKAINPNSTSNGISHLLGFTYQFTNNTIGIGTSYFNVGATNINSATGEGLLVFYAPVANATNEATTALGSPLLGIDSRGGIATYATNPPITITATGLTNTGNVNWEFDVVATAATYTVYNSAGTSVFTNSSVTGTYTHIINPGGKIIAASGLAGAAHPF